MASILSNQTLQNQLQGQASQFIEIPEEAMRRVPDVVKAKNHSEEAPSLLSTAGWSAAATGVFQAKPVWENRERGSAAKWFRDGKIYQKANKITPFISAGKAVRNIGAGALAGTAITAPAEWISGKMSEKYKNDKNFDPSHFAAIATPAAISGTLGTGAFMNTMDQMKASGKIGTKQMVKNIVSPKNIAHSTGKELRNVKNLLTTKRFGSGLLAAGMMGLSAIEPIQYIMQTRKKKDNTMKKEASVKTASSSLKTKALDYAERKRRIGLGVIAAGTYIGAKNFIEDKKKKIDDHANRKHGAHQHLFGEAGLIT